jgi:hypothetical protein
MPEVVKYATCEPEDTQKAAEALWEGDIRLNAASRVYPLRNDARHLYEKNYFAVENTQVIAEGQLVTFFLQLQQCLLCIIITALRSLALKAAN